MEITLIEYILILALALIFDITLGEPRGFLLKIHPVILTGKICRKLTRNAGRIYGVCVWFISVSPVLMFYSILPLILLKINYIMYVVITAYIVKLSFSIKLMRWYVKNIIKYWHVNRGRARILTQEIVRRDVFALNDKHVLSAVIESLSESLVDGYTSTLFYYPLLGWIGALLQRLTNTMDSLLGYPYKPFISIGWFSAKLDTLINYLPARITAILTILASLICGLDWKNCWRIIRRDHANTKSINAGWVMAAFAGALRVRLEKPNEYALGDDIDELSIEKVKQALRLYDTVVVIYTLIIVFSLLFITPLTHILTEL